MTKRALSLLLTLVMVLSLCVPALAADDGFVAEAPADVIEEAPAAPVEPEAPEAEEPAEEPVVDEPIAEEADAPEIAAVMEEEDLPLLVKLGVVSKDAHWALCKAVEAAEELMPKVEAGELYEMVFNTTGYKGLSTDTDAGNYIADPEEYDPLKDSVKNFMAAYEEAKKYLDAIDGVEIDEDVTTSSVTTVAAALAKYVDPNDLSYTANRLTSAAGGSTKFTQNELYNLLKYASRTYVNGTGMNAAGDEATLKTNLAISSSAPKKVDTAVWKKSYHADYLTALQSALDAVAAYNDEASTYKDFTTVAKQILALLQKEAAGARPAASDMSALTSAINSAQTAKDNYKAPSKYVMSTTDTSLGTLLGEANALLNGYQGLNGFATNATYYAYNDAIKNINDALVEKTNSLQYRANKWNSAGTVDVTVSVKKVDGLTTFATAGDGKDYGYSYSVNGVWYDQSTGTKDAAKAYIQKLTTTWKNDDKYTGELSGKFNLAKVGTDNIVVGDQIVLRFHESDGQGGYEPYYFKEVTFTVTDGYDGPKIKSATFASGDSAAKLTGYDKGDLIEDADVQNIHLQGGVIGNSAITVTLTDTMADYDHYEVNVVNGKNKVAYDGTALKGQASSPLTNVDETYLVGGDMTVTLWVNTDSTGKPYPDDDYIDQSRATVTVEPLSKWNSIAVVKEILADASDLVQSDYKFKASGRVDVYDLASAFQTINGDIAKVTNMINDSRTANSGASRQTVLTALNEIIAVRKYLEQKTPDTDALNKLMAQAKAIIDEGEDPWTFDSWGALKDAYADASKVTATTLQSDVNDLAADLQAALNGMTKEGEVDKTALNAAITAAKALKEEDYTPESWAAAKAAIDEAVKNGEAVAANEEATQAQVNTAANAITAAMATLKKVTPDEPEILPPAGGTGWRYDPTTGDYYFFKNSKLVSNYWVGKVDGASAWDGNWYYVDADGKLTTGMQYLDDLHGGYGWYFLQPTDKNGEIGKMLTGWQYVNAEYGTCYFSAKSGEAGKCTYSTVKGDWNGTTWVK